jgi:hypothetical protein
MKGRIRRDRGIVFGVKPANSGIPVTGPVFQTTTLKQQANMAGHFGRSAENSKDAGRPLFGSRAKSKRRG